MLLFCKSRCIVLTYRIFRRIVFSVFATCRLWASQKRPDLFPGRMWWNVTILCSFSLLSCSVCLVSVFFCAFHCGYFVFGYCRRQLRSTAADIAMCLSWCGWVSGWTVAEPMMKSLYHRHICAESAIKPQPTLLSPIFIHADAVVWWRHV